MTDIELDLIARGLLDSDGCLTRAGQDYVEPILDRLAPYVPRPERTAKQQKADLLWGRRK